MANPDIEKAELFEDELTITINKNSSLHSMVFYRYDDRFLLIVVVKIEGMLLIKVLLEIILCFRKKGIYCYTGN